MALFQLNDVSFRYPNESSSLQHIQLTIEPGEFVVLIGPSGCGKTTLLKQLKRELAPAGQLEGTIIYDGQLLQELGAHQAATDIGFVLQNPDNQIVTDVVWHELAFGLENIGTPPEVIRRRVAEMAHFFGMQTWFHQKTSELSGGQKQLLNVAATMVMQPRVLLLDEPTAQLDPIAASEFIATLKRLHDELGLTIIMVEHRLEEVLGLATRAVVMEEGRILYNGSPRNIVHKLAPAHPMLLALPTPLRIFAALAGEGEAPLTIREGQRWLTRYKPQQAIAEQQTKMQEDVLLQAQDVVFQYEKKGPVILKHFSMTLYTGEFYSIVGGNGAGKSTALQVLMGLQKPQHGKVLLQGERLTKPSAMMALLPQDPKLLFVEKTVQLELRAMVEGGFTTAAKMQQLVEKLGLTELVARHPYDLSGGEQQKLAFAKLLLREPRVLLLDEPTKGLDAYAKQELAKMLKQCQKEGMTIVMVTHDIEFSARYSDRCALFFDGTILSVDEPRTFYSGNHFYTTAAHRMSRPYVEAAILEEEVIALCRQDAIRQG